ncbi:MAG: DUF2161 family putative PD-(D/E)XK-type phosphodiesterase [Paenibacillus sp.]|uniref:DUF2161 family putative PD-(D/E)XK-type phosphodiesterase n=1 Tax=Paenibacillus sp. TaxID=58172 RepID=UPI0029126472|nr:DUF2161 family putative PD-(D/E)XK-type phosphodiesterase [Paenibacillus sp.]MDU4696092.1 DUF2161 family putative PD-(D/E)XK-type phosphodiesterase [Paenibacillus sp.]
MAVQHETELYAPLKAFFEERGYEIKSEVRHCDLVGVRPDSDEPLIVEMKKTFNLSLLLQGLERQRLSSEVYLAVERNRAKKGAHNQRWSEITLLCRRLGLGLIAVTRYKTKPAFVEILCSPGNEALYIPGPKVVKRRAEKLLHEFHERSGDYNVGGSTGTKLVTAYRERALRIALAIEEGGGEMSPKDARDRSGVGSAAAILQRDYYGWFRRVVRGRYALTPAGAEGLRQYAHVVDGWRRAAATAEREPEGPLS